MAWISFNEAIEQAGVSRPTGRRRIRQLKEIDPVLHRKFIQPGKPMKLKAPEIVGLFRTDIQRFLSKLRPMKQKPGPKKFEGLKPIPQEYKDIADQIVHHPVKLPIEPTTKKIFNSIKDQNDRNKLIITLKICNDYLMGYDTLKRCCEQNGCDRKTFWRWRQESQYLNYLYGKARQKRNSILPTRDAEEAIESLRKQMRGYDYKEERKSCKIQIQKDGTEIRIPQKVDVITKHSRPNFAAAAFIATNRDPENWKMQIPIEDIPSKSTGPEDIIDNMSDKELDEYLKKGDKLFKKS